MRHIAPLGWTTREFCERSCGVLMRLSVSSALYALTVVVATLMFYNSTNFYLLHLGNAFVVIFMNEEPIRYVEWLYPPSAYAASFIALPFRTTSKHILIASSCNVVEQMLMHVIMLKLLPQLQDKHLYKLLRFWKVLFLIAIPFSFSMATIGTTTLYFSENAPFLTTLLIYTASHVSGNYLGLYSYYVLRGFTRHWPAQAYVRDLAIVCGIEVFLNAWTTYGDFRQAATVQIYPLLAYMAARYNQYYTALADVLVTVIVLVAVVLKRGPYYTASASSLSLFISLFIVLTYSALLTTLLSFFMEQRKAALSNVSQLKDDLYFVSSQVGHDVRAPLTHIISVCENMQTATFLAAATDLEEMSFSCQTIVDIMDSWLIMLSKSNKQAVLTTKDASVHDDYNDYMSTAESIITLLRKIAVYGNRVILLSEKNLTLKIEHFESTALLKYNNKMLQHVIINLVANAIKYSKEGQICVTVAFSQTNQELCVAVSDQGIGIAQENIPQLFNNFFRIRDSERQHQQQFFKPDGFVSSYGVGLAIVQQLVTKMHGSIHVTSELHAGSVFTVTVPCHDVKSDKNDNIDEENQKQQVMVGNLCNMRVLVAEDNKLCATVITRHLSACCASVEIISDGALVMQKLRKCEFDVLLLDGSLPNVRGHEILASLLQEINDLQLVPKIITISGGDVMLIDGNWSPLLVEHCNKPFTKQQLLAAVLKAIQRA